MFRTNRIARWQYFWRALQGWDRPHAGDRVRVHSGTFEDIEGTIVARRGKCRVVVALDVKQAGVTLEIDEHRIQVVGT